MIINSKKHPYYFFMPQINNDVEILLNNFYSYEFKLNDSYNKTIIIVNDFGYKYDYMMNIINEFVNDNSRVITFDLIGHNFSTNLYKKSKASKNNIYNTFVDKIKDINLIEEISKQEYYDFLNNNFCNLTTVINDYNLNENNAGKKLFIISHSLGSLSVFCNLYSSLGSWDKENESFITGIISLSPNIKDLRFKNKFLFNVFNFIWPGKLLTYDLKLKYDFEKMIENDFKKKCTVRAINSFLNLQHFIIKKTDMITTPNLFFHAKDDEISSYDDSLNFFNNLNSSKKEFITYTDGGHNLFLGDKSTEIIDKIKSWMSELI
jgi:alpha-beta hydrolase superfamily lysophospholipase